MKRKSILVCICVLIPIMLMCGCGRKKRAASGAENATQELNGQADVVSRLSGEEIEQEVTEYIRPLYDKIMSEKETYEEVTKNGITYFYDGKECVIKEYAKTGDISLTRRYYFDTNSGEMVFAFMFDGTEEYRLYFKDDILIRYIDNTKVVQNNPDSVEARRLARMALEEAYHPDE